MDSLGTRIRKARERRGMSQGELAKELNVSLRTVGNWERDETHPRNSLTRIEDLLGSVSGPGQPSVTEENPRPEGEVDRSSVGPGSEDASYVADRGPNDPPARITDEELLAVIRRQRQELDELERRLTGGPVDGAS